MGFWSRWFGDDTPTHEQLAMEELSEEERAARRKQLLKKVRKLEIITRRVVNDQMAGSYHSAFKGRGMNFSEVRLYQPGDEVRFIDWNVSARMNDVYVKQFVEERELTVFLLVDASASQLFGTGERAKRDAAAELGALLAFSAIKNNDRVGLIMFTDEVELFVPPKKGRKHVLRVIREIIEFHPERSGTSISGALDYLNRVSKRSSVAFLISDFQDSGYRKPLLVSAKRHDLIPIMMVDPAERDLKDLGTLFVEDPETGEILYRDTSSEKVREDYRRLDRSLQEKREQMFRRLDIDYVRVETDKSFYKPLVNYFQLRARRY